ncbi:hypothetical protein A3Q56_05348 [Intoshia linei]|uniref:G-protein coupled receptors family 1 profile domain-containing protein n=1 Tax=Intoshia linei TaxID=1819745 RepID=A0A177AZL5_9BILA|nr:hypothetical protein A3Q56_05348 [Intoshia linei]
MGFFVSDLSVWLIVSVTTERMIVCMKPLSASRICTIRKAAITIMVLTLFCLSINAIIIQSVELIPINDYTLFESNIMHNDSTILKNFTLLKYNKNVKIVNYICYGTKNRLYLVETLWPWIDLCKYSIIPSIIVICLNIKIIHNLMYNNKNILKLKITGMIVKNKNIMEQTGDANVYKDNPDDKDSKKTQNVNLMGKKCRESSFHTISKIGKRIGQTTKRHKHTNKNVVSIRNRRLTVMLVSLSIIFIGTTTPLTIYLIVINMLSNEYLDTIKNNLFLVQRYETTVNVILSNHTSSYKLTTVIYTNVSQLLDS